LLGVASADDGASDRRTAQCPGDGNFTRGTAVARADLAKALDEFEIFLTSAARRIPDYGCENHQPAVQQRARKSSLQ